MEMQLDDDVIEKRQQQRRIEVDKTIFMRRRIEWI